LRQLLVACCHDGYSFIAIMFSNQLAIPPLVRIKTKALFNISATLNSDATQFKKSPATQTVSKWFLQPLAHIACYLNS
jgi:hypothetical protein